MRIPLILATLILLLQIICDAYLFFIAWRRCRKIFWAKLQLGLGAFFIAYIVGAIVLFSKTSANAGLPVLMWLLLFYIAVYASKFTFIIFDLIASIPTVLKRHRRKRKRKRWNWISWLGAGMATIVFGSIIWGAAINRFQLQVNNVDIEISDLPDSFNGYRIAQISDLHVGTFGNDTTFVSKMVDRINALDCNLVVFTGDIVNQHTQELRPFVKTLRRITPPDGVISILGNHDYGDYYKWASDTDKEVNMQALLDKQIDMGWELLTNNSTTIFSDVPSDSIVIIGVENWGDPPFSQLGDLRAAYPNLSDSATKILLTHNPMHWKSEVENNDSCNIHLTLSGHTHAMQVNIAGISPAAIRYPKCWAGRHVSADGKRTLYVNTGIGTVGLPMRIGATPEITVFTLKNNKR